jgi:hypothetical protein
MALILDGTTGVTTPTGTGDVSVGDDLIFTGTGNRITGDFSNATAANRVWYQTSTANTSTIFDVVPSGTGVAARGHFYNSSDPSNASVLQVGIQAGGSNAIINSTIAGTGTYLPMTFFTGGSERVRIDTSGNVGIGTNLPANRLTVAGATPYVSVFNATAGTSGSPSFGGIRFYGFAENTNGLVASVDAGNSQASDFAGVLRFSTQAAGGGGLVESMRIDSSGNLLVGNNTINDFRFSSVVNGINVGTATFRNIATSGIVYDQTQVIVGQSASSGFMFQRFYSGGGTAVQFAVRGDGVIFAQNTTVQSISDARTKENVRNADDGLQTVLGLRPVRFDFKEGFGNNRKNQLGFIAQEVEAVFPDAVDAAGEKDEQGEPYKSVGPGAMIPVLVKAIQEQQAIITALTARVEALEGAQA